MSGADYTDINQGAARRLLLRSASLAEVALRSPSTITNMFVVNGDGTYTVQFFNNGAGRLRHRRLVPADQRQRQR